MTQTETRTLPEHAMASSWLSSALFCKTVTLVLRLLSDHAANSAAAAHPSDVGLPVLYDVPVAQGSPNTAKK